MLTDLLEHHLLILRVLVVSRDVFRVLIARVERYEQYASLAAAQAATTGVVEIPEYPLTVAFVGGEQQQVLLDSDRSPRPVEGGPSREHDAAFFGRLALEFHVARGWPWPAAGDRLAWIWPRSRYLQEAKTIVLAATKGTP